MESLNRADLKEILEDLPLPEDKGISLKGAVTDSRLLKSGDVFFALVGDSVNGHQFIDDVLKRGASAVVANPKYLLPKMLKNPAIVKTRDPERALRNLAKTYRKKFSIPFIGITGSTGKTTTKEILATILNEKYQALVSPGNLNTEIGLPLSLLDLTRHHQVGVLEMGAHKKGDIALLADLLSPRNGIVTNVGNGHMQYFGTKQNVAEEKAELVKVLPRAGNAILNFDDGRVRMMSNKTKATVISYGINEQADVMAKNIETFLFQTRFQIQLGGEKSYEVSLPLAGRHNVYNCLAAVAAARVMGVSDEQVLAAIKKIKAIKQRQEVLVRRGLTIINDTYNANPESVMAALDFLSQLDPARRKLVVLGDMLELGEISDKAHARLGEIIAEHDFYKLYTLGNKAALVSMRAREKGMTAQQVHHFTDHKHLVDQLKDDLKGSDIILVKGSRGMHMEKVTEALQHS